MHSPICQLCLMTVSYVELGPGEVFVARLGTYRVLLPDGRIVEGAKIAHSSDCGSPDQWVGKPWSQFCLEGQDGPEGDPICR